MVRNAMKMYVILLIMILTTPQSMGLAYNNDSTADQLPSFAMRVHAPIGTMTTSSGFPVSFQDSQSINTRLLLNQFFMDTMTHFTAERIPERIVHGKGTGAFGYFKVTHDLSDICKAKLFSEVGKTTPLVARLSLILQRPGGPDLSRETRGFAVKFYTDEGNYDFVAINVEMFLIKDPILLPSFIRSLRKNPTTLVADENSLWDFVTLRPEGLSMLIMKVFADRGIPDSYRHIPAFTIHTFELINNIGNRTFVRFHLLPDFGIRNLTTAQASLILDPDYATRDLYNAIANGRFPSWTLNVQTISETEVSKAKFDIFDITKYWPLRDYPLRPIGTLVLNRNPENQFAEVEQLAFNPGNLVPGIRGVDTAFEGRVLAYREAHLHRLGVNFNKIRVNCPFGTVARTYNRDGPPPVEDNERDIPNYYPNSFHGPVPYLDNTPPILSIVTDLRPNNFDQAADQYNEMSEGERCRMIENILLSMTSAEEFLQERAVKLLRLIHEDLGNKIEHGLKLLRSGLFTFYQCKAEK